MSRAVFSRPDPREDAYGFAKTLFATVAGVPNADFGEELRSVEYVADVFLQGRGQSRV
jgi:hypothetical protein